MNSANDNQVPSMELPDVSPESGDSVQIEQSQMAPVTETGAAVSLEQGVSQSPPTDQPFDTNLGPQPAVSTSFDPAQMINPTPTQPPSTQNPAIADDTDLIEKEWVSKAKQIVEQTKADPHVQNNEMNKVRVDYLKKRYNKEVKLIEE